MLSTKTLQKTFRHQVLLALIFGIFLFAEGSLNAAAPTPSSGSATVDGNYGEWNLGSDFFTNLCTASDCGSKPVTAKAYLRYDCSAKRMYVLVLATPGHLVNDQSPNDQWAAINSINNKVYFGHSGNDGNPPDFAYVYSGSNAVGYEASFPINAGSYSIAIHMEVDGNNTSGSGFVSLTMGCPTAATLTLFDATAKADKVVLRWQTGTELNIMGFNVWRSEIRNGNYRKINGARIEALHIGTVMGDNYRYVDAISPAGKKLFYKLEIVKTSGSSEWSQIAKAN